MRVVLLTHYFPPEVGAPQTRLAELATGLAARGFEVTVHTAPPHYPDGVIRAPYRNRPLHRERLGDGVRVIRSPVYATPNRGVARRVANHLSHAASALATAPASGACDAVVAETPPLFTAAAGALYARGKRAALLLHVADLWPASAVELGMLSDPRAVAAAERLERWCYRAAARIVVPTAGMGDRLAAVREARGKVAVVPPAVAAGRFEPRPMPPGGPLRVVYAGTLGLAHGIETLIEAAILAGPDRVELTVAGSGAEAEGLHRLVERHGASNVRLTGSLPRDAIPDLYAEHHVGAVMLRDRPLFAAALPTKLFEIMAAGRPAVVSARGEAAELVRRAGAGIAVAPEDAEALASALVELGSDPERLRAYGEAGRRFVLAAHDRGPMIDRWAELLEQAVGERRRDS